MKEPHTPPEPGPSRHPGSPASERSAAALSAVPRKGAIVETLIEDVGERDTCFGRLPGGLAVFVHGPLAVGDRVRAEVVKRKKNYISCRLLEVLHRSPQRVAPPCAHFGHCGGCKWQHVVYAEQLRLKQKQVADALEHIGGFPNARVDSILPADPVFHYRNKMEFSFSRQRYLIEGENGGDLSKPRDFALGLHAPRLYEKIVDIDLCHLATAEMNATLDLVKRFCRDRALSIYSTRSHDGLLRHLVLRAAPTTGQFMVNLVTSWHDAPLMQELGEALQRHLGVKLTTFVNNVTARKNMSSAGDAEHIVFGPGSITEHVGPLRVKISANSFFQTNTRQAERLYETALAGAALRPEDVVYDFYSGTGILALLAAPRCRRVLGIEMAATAVADARENAERNGVANCRFLQLDLDRVQEAIPTLSEFGAPDVVLVDPPRVGLHRKVVAALLNLAPGRVVYVSCNPASLARDARALCAEDRYRLEEIRPIDMFPHTSHIECVARFEARRP